MASREELERAREALSQATAKLIELAAQGTDLHPTDEELEHAKAYASTAAMMRRRAERLRAQGHHEHADHELGRAEQFDARAEVKRAGRPMPRHLRTPAESLASVDEFRRALADLLDAFGDIGADEWSAFTAALTMHNDSGMVQEACTRNEAFLTVERILVALGVEPGAERAFCSFASPLDPVATR